ncbi:MAG: MATE family efflux transporter [Paludibacteraceae bacterium]|nr:MATE family efflux transporter [Paludibacteraceae bacterium]
MLRLAVPSILANITIPLVGIVDTAIAGHISNAAAIGGIAIGTMLFDLLYWNFGFLRVGTAGMTAQAWGKRKADTADSVAKGTLGEPLDILAQSVSIALGGAVLILLLQWVFLTLALLLIPCSAEVAEFARRYFFIRVWAAPATLTLMALKGWFIGMQDTVAAMITDLVVNCVNMLASWLLAVYTPLGAMGVAWGTLIAQFSGLIVAIVLCKRRISREMGGGEYARSSLREALQWRKIRKLFVLNVNLFVRSLCFMVVYVGFTSLAAKYGDTELAVSAIMMKLFMLFSYFIDGFAYAGEALTGRFFGENNEEGVDLSVKILLWWTLAIGALCTLVYGLFGTGMIGLMTDQHDVIAASEPYLIWLVLMPVVSCLAFMWDGIFVGATAGRQLRNCMIWSAIGFLVTYILLNRYIGIQALYLAYFVHLAVRALYLTVKWRGTKTKMLYPQV